jgi:hypothetical protein
VLLVFERVGLSVRREIMNVILAHHNFLRMLLSNLSEELVPVEFQGIEHISNDLGRNQTDFSHPCEEFLVKSTKSEQVLRRRVSTQREA